MFHNFGITNAFFSQTFNAIKKMRESSSASPVAETEGTVTEEVQEVKWGDKEKLQQVHYLNLSAIR